MRFSLIYTNPRRLSGRQHRPSPTSSSSWLSACLHFPYSSTGAHSQPYSARTTPMPTLRELDTLFELLPELPPPAPRKKFPLPAQIKSGKDRDTEPGVPGGGPPKSVSFSLPHRSNLATGSPVPASSTASLNHLRKRLLSIFGRPAAPVSGADASRAPRPPPRPNPFPSLKQGKKTIVVAVVDAGSVGFFRFGQGTFEEWPMA